VKIKPIFELAAPLSGFSVALSAICLLIPVAGIAESGMARIELSGESAQRFLDETSEGHSLIAALNAARFGLKRSGHAPFEEASLNGSPG